MSLNRVKIFSTGVVTLAAAIAIGLSGCGKKSGADAEAAYNAAKQSLAEGKADAVLTAVEQFRRAVQNPDEPTRKKWASLEIQAVNLTGDLPRLLDLHAKSPGDFATEEAASINVCRGLLQLSKDAEFQKLRAEWKAKEAAPVTWFELDVDTLLMRGKRDEAVAFLNSKSFDGPADCGRLGRLAMLTAQADPAAAWKNLERAVQLDPRNSEIRLMRGQFLERSGKIPQSQGEYAAALGINPGNPQLRDQLGLFYLRRSRYDYAVATWGDGLTNGTSDKLWERTLFWNKVTRTFIFDWTSAKPPAGDLEPFVKFLLALKPGEYWNEDAFQKTAGGRGYEKALPEIFWLKLVDALQHGREDDAMAALVANPFRPRSWQLEVESALMRVLNFRKSDKLAFPEGVNIALNDTPRGTRHQLFEQLDALTKNPADPVPAELARLLKGRNAFAAVFLAAGWAECALQLPHDDVFGDDQPAWLVPAFTRAQQVNRSMGEALKFAAAQKSTPELEHLTAEIQIQGDQMGEGINKLTELAKADTDAGANAALLLAQTFIRVKQYDLARRSVTDQPRLAKSLAGRELAAKIALLEEKLADAEKIYAGIEAESDDAKLYFAKKAFDAKDWARARQLTEDVLQRHPESEQLRGYIEAIRKAETGN